MKVNLIGLNPPIPSQDSKNDSNDCVEGKKLLNLLKSLEKSQNSNSDVHHEFDELEGKVLESLSGMESIFSRKGLLQRDVKKAQEIENVMSSGTLMSQSNSSGGKKRKRGGASGSSSSISSILNMESGNLSSEEVYIVSNLCRILIPQGGEDSLMYPSGVIAASAKVFFVICEYCRAHLSTVTSSVEHAMITSIASQIINGMNKTMQRLLVAMSKTEKELENAHQALQYCCLSSSAVIILSNTRLSRSNAILDASEKVAHDVLLYAGESDDTSSLLDAAATFIATIPLAGSSTGASTTQLWTNKILMTVEELKSTIFSFFPIVRSVKRKKGAIAVSNGECLAWITELRNRTASQTDRVTAFIIRIKSYVSIAKHLLKMDGYDISQSTNGMMIPITTILDCCEQMLNFSSIAETKYLSTKSGLRDVSIEGGLLSPSAAVAIANSVKYLGHDLFQTVLASLSNNSLQYGKQMLRITHSTLQSSSSYALRKVVDPVSTTSKTSSKKWLHSSIPLRTRAVRSFILLMQRLGSSVATTQTDTITKILAFIIGSLLEQIGSTDSFTYNQDCHWGTIQDRIDLICACTDALSSLLTIVDGFMSIENRSLVESVASTCLSSIKESMNDSSLELLSSGKIKTSFLNFGMTAISTPWPDGGASILTESLRSTAFALKFDRDPNVSSTAYIALDVCNVAMTHRSPPLVILTRSVNEPERSINSKLSFSREMLESDMAMVNEEILNSKFTKEPAKKVKTKKGGQKKDLIQKGERVEMDVSTDKTELTEDNQKDGEKSIDCRDKMTGRIEGHLEAEKQLRSDDSNTGHGDDDDNDPIDNIGGEHFEIEARTASVIEKHNNAQDEGKNDREPDSESDLSHHKNDQLSNLDDDYMDDFPEIVDCGPDEEDR